MPKKSQKFYTSSHTTRHPHFISMKPPITITLQNLKHRRNKSTPARVRHTRLKIQRSSCTIRKKKRRKIALRQNAAAAPRPCPLICAGDNDRSPRVSACLMHAASCTAKAYTATRSASVLKLKFRRVKEEKTW